MALISPTWYRQGHGYWFPYLGQDRSPFWLSMDESATGRLVQAVTDDDGEIFLRFPVGYGVGTWAEVATGITGERPCVRYARRKGDGAIVLTYEDVGGAIKRQTTINEGGTWSVATTIAAAGKFPATALLPGGEGATADAWWVTGGAIKFRTFDAFGSAVTAEVTAVAAAGAAEDAIGLVARKDGSFALSYRNGSGAIVNITSTDGGQTWA
ncbi:MAG: hypothetical protein V4671_20745 [Armatimonadota bacterium]